MILGGIFGPIFDFVIWGVFLQFLPWIWTLGWASSSTNNLGVNPWLYPLWFYGFLFIPPKPRFFSSSKIEREIFRFGKNRFWELVSLCWGDPSAEVSSDLVPYSSRITFGKKGGEFWEKITFLETSYRTISDRQFQPDVRSLFWPYFANQVSVWSHSSSASFVILWWSFLSCWL
jgi:hypothetical protein